MDDEVRAELARLRARAYGPARDIDDDPAALRRLAQLERESVESRRPATPAPDGAHAAVGGPPGSDAVDETAAEPRPPTGTVEAPAAAGTDGHRPRRRRWPAFAVAAGLVVVLAIVAAQSFASAVVWLRVLPIRPEVPPVATLAVDQTIPTPNFLGTGDGDSQVFEGFAGLTALTSPSRTGNDDDVCLVILRTDSFDLGNEFIEGPAFSGCGPEEFPVVASLRVTPDLPAELRERFDDGSALLFVLEGGRIEVFAAEERETET